MVYEEVNENFVLTAEEIQEIIDNEIGWCKKNGNNDLSKEYQDGFIAGLKQAKELINKATNELYLDR